MRRWFFPRADLKEGDVIRRFLQLMARRLPH